MKRAANKPAFFWLAVVTACVLACGFGWAIWWIVVNPVTTTSFGPGWRAEDRGTGPVVTAVHPFSSTAGKLRPGDRVLAINGDTRASKAIPIPFLLPLQPGDEYTVRFARGGQELQQALRMQASPRSATALLVGTFLLISLAFGIMSTLMGVLRPEGEVTRLGFIAGMAMAFRFLIMASGEPAVAALISPASEPLPLAIGYYFYCRFSGVRVRGLWLVLLLLFSAISIAMFAVNATVAVLLLQPQDRAIDLAIRYAGIIRLRPVLQPFFGRLYLFVPMAIVAVTAWSYFRQTEIKQRRRMRWAVFGSIIGVLPQVLSGLSGMFGVRRFVWPFPFGVAHAFLILIPITLAYAALKHQLLGIRLALRLGIQYLLARNVLTVVLLLPLAGLLLPIVRNPDRTITQLARENPIFLNLLFLAAIGAGLKYRAALRSWVDRRFFREAYSQEKILRELIERVSQIEDLDEIARLVSRQLEVALHPQRLHVFYRETESSGLKLGFSSDVGGGLSHLPQGEGLLGLLESAQRPLEFPSQDKSRFGAQTEAWLAELEARLLVPISGARRQLCGLILLGEKKSEEPYTTRDKELLQAIAVQMALVCEKMWLRDRVREEGRIRQEVLAHLPGEAVQLLCECPRCGLCFDRSTKTCPEDGVELELTLPVERTIEGKYRLDRRIGRGGMGAVFEAADLRLNRKVAVKILLGSMFGKRDALRRFEREAQAAARLAHPNIIAIHDFGATGSDGAYLVMELVAGLSWRAELQRRRALEPAIAALWFDQLLSGLRVAHDAGVIHRDLKPENVIVAGDRIKILDFGLAKVRAVEGETDPSMTLPGTLLGTLGYMAPEQLAGRPADERSDIFAVGVMAVEAITGRRPFDGQSHAEILTAMLRGDFRLAGDGPEVERLRGVLAQCLAKDPDARFRRVADLHGPLVEALAGCPPLTPGIGEPGQVETRSIGG